MSDRVWELLPEERDALEIKRLRARLDEAELLLREIWESVPSSYDAEDPMVQRHAQALRAAGRFLSRGGAV